MDSTATCIHEPVWLGRRAVVACTACQEITWLSEEGAIDPSQGMAAIFGGYDLVGSVTALGAPSREVLVYEAPSARKRRYLNALPTHVWLRCSPNLWMSTDGSHLLLSTPHQLLFENLTRGA